MNEIISTTRLVKQILEEDKLARICDKHLILEVDKKLYPSILEMSYGHAIKHRADLGLPPFETIRRTRQKLQRRFPELAADENVEEKRAELEEKYFSYAVSEVKRYV